MTSQGSTGSAATRVKSSAERSAAPGLERPRYSSTRPTPAAEKRPVDFTAMPQPARKALRTRNFFSPGSWRRAAARAHSEKSVSRDSVPEDQAASSACATV